MDSGYKKDQDAFDAVKKCKEKLETELKKLNYEGQLGVHSFKIGRVRVSTSPLTGFTVSWPSDGKEENLIERKRQLSREVGKLRETHELLMAKFPDLRFEYRLVVGFLFGMYCVLQ